MEVFNQPLPLLTQFVQDDDLFKARLLCELGHRSGELCVSRYHLIQKTKLMVCEPVRIATRNKEEDTRLVVDNGGWHQRAVEGVPHYYSNIAVTDHFFRELRKRPACGSKHGSEDAPGWQLFDKCP